MVSCSGWAHDCVAAFYVFLFMMWLHCVILNEIHVHRQRFVKAWCYFRRFRCGSITHMWCKQNAEYICCLSHLFSFFLYTGKTLNRWDWRACDFWTQSTLILQSYRRFIFSAYFGLLIDKLLLRLCDMHCKYRNVFLKFPVTFWYYSASQSLY